MTAPALQVTVPIETEVILRHGDAVQSAVLDHKRGLLIHLDLRKLDWAQKLGLPPTTCVHWEKLRTCSVQELSSFLMPICYRVHFGDGWYLDPATGRKTYFGVQAHLRGMDLQRGVTTTALRAAVLLAVLAGIGLRSVCWLLGTLFHLEVSKSALGRWIQEVASALPEREEMLRRLQADKPVTQGHLDEIFPRGWGNGCVLVLKDEHGRIIDTEAIAERSAEQVAPFLERLKAAGLGIRTFYVDGCEAYREAIRALFPEAVIQYDYFHVLQNCWKKLWRAMVGHRKDLKERATQVKTPWYRARLLALARTLWECRGLVFKNPDSLTPEELARLVALLEQDAFAAQVRAFLERVWGIFRDSAGDLGARQRLGRLKQRPEVQQDPESPFAKVVAFLEDRFEDMTAFLRHPGVQRNSLAESGIRVLRRLEQGHDGFRGEPGRQTYLRLYQAIKYLHWGVYRADGSLGLPARPDAAAS